jgi:hypothetical protein
MVLTPRIAGTNLVPTGGGRFAAAGAMVEAESVPVNPAKQMDALIYGGDSEFQYDQLGSRDSSQRKQQSFASNGRNSNEFARVFGQKADRRFNNSMLQNSSESFAAAFDSVGLTAKLVNGTSDYYRPQISLDRIISTYELTASVIYNDISPVGEKFSIVL